MRSSSKDSKTVLELWLDDKETSRPEGARAYHPAVLIECKMTFRNLRSGIHHSDERGYTAWYPESDLPVDWDRPAVNLPPGTKFTTVAPFQLPEKPGNFYFTQERLFEMEDELVERLIRTEKLRLLYNPVFKIYSTPDESREEFLSRVSEKGLSDLEPELRELMRRFELKFEQVREAEERKGRKEPLPEPDLLKMIEKRSELLTSKSRLTTMFLNSAKMLLKPTRISDVTTIVGDNTNRELHETLCHIEQEASDAVSALCEEFLGRAAQCDNFEIGLQRQNIQVLRRAVLWIAQ
jgi:hypothetical protein